MSVCLSVLGLDLLKHIFIIYIKHTAIILLCSYLVTVRAHCALEYLIYSQNIGIVSILRYFANISILYQN